MIRCIKLKEKIKPIICFNLDCIRYKPYVSSLIVKSHIVKQFISKKKSKIEKNNVSNISYQFASKIESNEKQKY